ncbi:hypothetical protein K432DRAFT_386014 [Lepidopterella palustris CBS 459.81]|uniref:Uncharacterized protein n=1 Tax=Lepidopterella palustris CBS 459.81 TaxID=1314670 RepID=A0A8E2JAU3_9PEZI|nr:hypothetical protein K432DRAFT_386014 [Lepidopterella palustris CBS 459.81]
MGLAALCYKFPSSQPSHNLVSFTICILSTCIPLASTGDGSQASQAHLGHHLALWRDKTIHWQLQTLPLGGIQTASRLSVNHYRLIALLPIVTGSTPMVLMPRIHNSGRTLTALEKTAGP